MVEIKLNKNEYDYLRRASFLSKNIQDVLFSCKQYNENFLLEISPNQADEIRDLCGEQLQFVGFDEKYELTYEGKILESLIDKFFLG